MKHVIMIASAISLGLSACAQETKLTDTNTPQVTVIRAEAKALLASDERLMKSRRARPTH